MKIVSKYPRNSVTVKPAHGSVKFHPSAKGRSKWKRCFKPGLLFTTLHAGHQETECCTSPSNPAVQEKNCDWQLPLNNQYTNKQGFIFVLKKFPAKNVRSHQRSSWRLPPSPSFTSPGFQSPSRRVKDAEHEKMRLRGGGRGMALV